MEADQIWQKIKEQRVLPLFYHDDLETCVSVMRNLYDAGIRCIEFTNRGQQALDNFKGMVKERNKTMKDLVLATGTIKTSDEATRFIEAGADFLISPVFDAGVFRIAELYSKLWIPGCMTPTEIHLAQQSGCRFVKLFPGNILGPGFVEGIGPLFSGIGYIVTGGVDITKESIGSWLRSGVAAVGLGSKLISKELLASKDYESLRSTTAQLLQMAKAV